MLWHWLHPLAAHPGLGGACMALAVLVALAVDRLWGEPPARWHPVVWMGRALGACGARIAPAAETARNLKHFWLAALAWCALAALVVIATAILQGVVLWFGVSAPAHPPGLDIEGVGMAGAQAVQTALVTLLTATALGLLLKPMLALAALQNEVRAVENALGESLQAGRARLAWLVSREVDHLSADEVRQSAIESLAENLNDSVVAPLFWFALAGLPGAALYRFANTADAMWGYRGVYNGGNWEWAGKWAAWADDVLSWLPARITGVALALVAGARLSDLRVQARHTPSPNSGWPMAAMALGLGVCLHKPGVYALNAGARSVVASDTRQAIFYASKVLLALVGLAQAALICIAVVGCS